MHIAFIVENIPNPSTGGGAITGWSLIQAFLEHGHRLTAIPLIPASDLEEAETKKRLEALRITGAGVIPFPVHLSGTSRNHQNSWQRKLMSLYHTFFPRISDYYPWASLAPEMKIVLRQIQPDAILTYHWPPTASLAGITDIAPRMATIGDLDFLVGRYRNQIEQSFRKVRGNKIPLWRQVYHSLRGLVSYLQQSRIMIQLLREYDNVGSFSSHHAEWIRRRGLSHCHYLHTPVPDGGGARWYDRRKAKGRQNKLVILMIGHLGGTATLSGLYLFVKKTLPSLEKKLGTGGFEVRIVGGETLPPDLFQMLNRPSVQFLGHKEHPDDEFLSADILLVPTPIKLGNRVRIVVGWSFGCCVVAHRANAFGIPEMIHGENALLAEDGNDLAKSVLRALGDLSLREKLGKAGRQTYEKYFSPSAAGGRIVEELENISSAQTEKAMTL